jgi:hypothetical protein
MIQVLNSNQELVCPLTKYSRQSFPLLKSMTVCRDNQGLKVNHRGKRPKNRRILLLDPNQLPTNIPMDIPKGCPALAALWDLWSELRIQ